MKEFIKNNGHWVRLSIFLVIVVFAAGKITHSHAELCKKVDRKVDKEIYDVQRQADRRELELQLDRIEQKIDVVTNLVKDRN